MIDKPNRRRFLRSSMAAAGVTSFYGLGALSAYGQLEENTRRALGIPDDRELPADAIYGPWREMRAVRQGRVIDMHCHAWETRTQGRTYEETSERHARGDYVDYSDEMIDSFDRHGIAIGALIPAFVPFEQVVETSYAKYSDRYILTAGLPTRQMVESGRTEEDLTPEELAQIFRTMLEEHGVSYIGETAGNAMRAIATRLGPRALSPVIDVILEHDVPVHLDPGSWSPTRTAIGGIRRYVSADVIDDVAGPLVAAYPDVTFIIAHAGGQFWQLDGQKVMRLLFSLDNTYTEISKSFNSELITTIIKGIGPERVMYGSDWNRPEMKTYGPYHLRAAYQHWNSLNTLARADISEEERDWVLYKSAQRLLRLDAYGEAPADDN